MATSTPLHRSGRTSTRDELAEQHVGFAKGLAHHLASRLPRCVDPEELESDAYLGLLKAAETFDRDRGVLFRSYAAKRIRGAMLDGLRERNGSRCHLYKPHFQLLDSEMYDDDDRWTTLAETIAGDSKPVGTELEMREEAELVMRRLDRASRKQFTDYHVRGLQQKDIAAKLGITPSAVSQRMKTIRKLIAEIRQEQAA